MTRTLLAVTLVLSSLSTAWATRVLNQPESSFELSLAAITLPEDAADAVSFKACALCRTATHEVTPATKYFVDGVELTFEDFLLDVQSISTRGAKQSTFVGLFVDNESQRVNRIIVLRRKQ